MLMKDVLRGDGTLFRQNMYIPTENKNLEEDQTFNVDIRLLSQKSHHE